MQKPASVAAYLSAAPKDKRAALMRLRRVIKATAPKSREAMSYGLIGYKHDGKPLIYVGYAKEHCAVYGYSSFAHAHPELFKDFELSKGTIRFSAEHPIPDRTITRMVRARMKEIEEGRGTTYARGVAKARR